MFITQEGTLSFLHYDLYAQALAKIERGHDLDITDVKELLIRRLAEPAQLKNLFETIVPQLYRYPAIDPPKFRTAVDRTVASFKEK